MSAMTMPVSSKSTCATNRLSPSADGIGESHVTTLIPPSAAVFAAGAIWSPELFEIISAWKPCVGAFVTNSIWPPWALDAWSGPV